MIVFKISVDIRNLSAEDQFDVFEGLLGAYRLDGHILGREWITLSTGHGFESHVWAPATDAFDPQFRNEWICRNLERIEAAGLSEPTFTLMGRDQPAANCRCEKSSSFILFTNYLQIENPIRCGDCFRTVPLYHLPRLESGEFVEVLSWADDYKACDTLFMNSGTAERFGYREMSEMDSSLSQRGRDICRHFEERTGKPVYYYLQRYYGRTPADEEGRMCPSCGGGWRLPETWHGRFDFRCDVCHLVSNIAPSLI